MITLHKVTLPIKEGFGGTDDLKEAKAMLQGYRKHLRRGLRKAYPAEDYDLTVKQVTHHFEHPNPQGPKTTTYYTIVITINLSRGEYRVEQEASISDFGEEFEGPRYYFDLHTITREGGY